MRKLHFYIVAVSVFTLWGCSLPYMHSYQDVLSPEEHFNLARAYEEKGEHEAAVKEYEAASAEIAEAHYYLGNLYFTKLDYQRAEKHYKLAIEKLPEEARAYNNLAWLYFVQGRNLKRAEELARQGVQLAPEEDAAPYRDTLAKIQTKRQEQ